MYKWAIVGILVLAFFLRAFNLSNLPAGFTPDEASFGYDAYSLIKTGHDQWGARWPIVFKSFGDYKLPVYTYLAIPSVTIFGLNEFAVRFPNAILGTLAVLFTSLASFELIGSKKVSVLSSLMLSVSYWHVALSRGAFEANLTTFFMVCGVYLFLRARKDGRLLPMSMLFFGINLFTYHSARIVTPVVVISLLWFYRESFPKRKKYAFASLIFLGMFLVALYSFFNGSGTRAVTSSIFSQDLGSIETKASVVNVGIPEIVAKILYGERMFELSKFIQNYLSYFSFNFLLTNGANEATYGMVPGIGVLSVVEFVGLILFGYQFFRKKEFKFAPFMFWFLVAPIPAAISVGPGNAANRSAVFMPVIQILSSVGITNFISKLKFDKKIFTGTLIATLGLGLLNIGRYFVEQPIVANLSMMCGMREAFSFLKEYPTSYVVLSDKLSEPHIYGMFYDPINPTLSQIASGRWNIEELKVNWVDQIGTYNVGRYTITEPQKTRFEDNTLVVLTPRELPESGVKVLKTVFTPDKKPILVVATKI